MLLNSFVGTVDAPYKTHMLRRAVHLRCTNFNVQYAVLIFNIIKNKLKL